MNTTERLRRLRYKLHNAYNVKAIFFDKEIWEEEDSRNSYLYWRGFVNRKECKTGKKYYKYYQNHKVYHTECLMDCKNGVKFLIGL